MITKKIYGIALLLLVFSGGCSSDYNSGVKEAQKSFYSGNYDAGAKAILPKIEAESNEQLLYMLEAGMMLHAGAEYEKSNSILLRAVTFADAQAISISKQAESLLLNERSTKYHGEDFELVLVHMYIGINFMMLGNFQSARVEFNLVSRRLDELRESGAKYEQNLMARYLTAVCYEQIAQLDNDEQALEFAYIEYKRIYKIKPDMLLVQQDLLRLAKIMGDTEDYPVWKKKFKNVELPDYKGKGELIVIHQAGRGAYKKSRGSLLDDIHMKGIIIIHINGMSLAQGVTIAGIMIALHTIEHPIPDYKSAKNHINHLQLSTSDGLDLGKTYMLEDIESTARLSAEKTYETTKAKVAAGIAVKAVATVASAMVAEKFAEQTPLKDGAKIIGYLAGAGVGTALASQIKPDLRCWQSLPSNLQISRVFLNPGTYTIRMEHVDSMGKSYFLEEKVVEIKAGEKKFINKRTLR